MSLTTTIPLLTDGGWSQFPSEISVVRFHNYLNLYILIHFGVLSVQAPLLEQCLTFGPDN